MAYWPHTSLQSNRSSESLLQWFSDCEMPMIDSFRLLSGLISAGLEIFTISLTQLRLLTQCLRLDSQAPVDLSLT